MIFYSEDIIHSNPEARQGNSVTTQSPTSIYVSSYLTTASYYVRFVYCISQSALKLRSFLSQLLNRSPVFQGLKHISLFKDCFVVLYSEVVLFPKGNY